MDLTYRTTVILMPNLNFVLIDFFKIYSKRDFMQKLILMLFALFLIGCTTTTKQPTEPITYSVLETTPSKIVGDDYKLPSHILTLPIGLFTWYPKGSTIHTLYGTIGVTGRFVWLNNCLLFNVDNTSELITPIF